MNPPPWNCETPADEAAFIEFVLDELDRLNADWSNSQEHEDSAALAIAIVEWERAKAAAQRAGLSVPPVKRRRGRQPVQTPGGPSALACAIRDVERMRAIFRKHWGKVNRHHRPTREDIASAFWELSPADDLKLRAHFDKQKRS